MLAKREAADSRAQYDPEWMQLRGLEPPHPCGHGDLNAARLPIPPQPRGLLKIAL